MPKKPQRNAFYFYMLDFKEEQRSKGVHYANLAEVAAAAGDIWKNLPPQIRSHYEGVAKKDKQKVRGSGVKYTSTGIPLSIIEQQEREKREAEAFELQDVKNMVKTNAFNNSILDEDIYLMDVNYYCVTNGSYLICESTVLRFNLRNGFRDFYHEMVYPGIIPRGLASEIKIGSDNLGIDPPDDTRPANNYMQMLANIIDYLKQKEPNMRSLPPLYTVTEKVPAVQDFIHHMCREAGEDEALFRVYKLSNLFFQLINSIKTNKDEGFPNAMMAQTQIDKDSFKYTPGLGCEHHEAVDKSTECTTARVKRWAFTIMDSCCPVAGIDVKPGQHVPPEYDVDSILLYKDSKTAWSGPTVAGVAGPPSSCNTTANDTLPDFNSTASTSAELTVRREKRTHQPMRMPVTDYSANIRPAPELTDDNEFPALSAGAGRGRGLVSGMRNMNLRN